MNCGICGNEYPITFLVAAHIKKRASCTDEEKRDFKNIIIPMCKFGCDDLYEKGYIAVENALVVLLESPDTTDVIKSYLKGIEGKICSYWNQGNNKYFQWHLEKFKKIYEKA